MTEQSNDYLMVRDEARRFLSDTMQPEYLKGLLEQPGTFDRRTWASVVEFGWPATSLPEEQGGLGLGWQGICVLAEELGRTTASIPLVASAAVAQLLLLDPDNAAARGHAALLVSGERYACLAVAQAGDAGLALAPRLQFKDGMLYGTTAITPFAATADYALVPALANGVFCLVLALLDQAAVTRAVVPAIDNSRAAATLTFDGSPALKVVPGPQAQQQLWNLLSLTALATAFEQIGGAQVCLDMARDYALERKAFGQQIGRFQSIKSKLADMYIRIELARGCALDALMALGQGDPEWFGLAASARVAAIDAYEVSARENIQTHGAIGVTWEAMPHHHYRRSRSLAVELGSASVWRERMLAEAGLGLDA